MAFRNPVVFVCDLEKCDVCWLNIYVAKKFVCINMLYNYHANISLKETVLLLLLDSSLAINTLSNDKRFLDFSSSLLGMESFVKVIDFSAFSWVYTLISGSQPRGRETVNIRALNYLRQILWWRKIQTADFGRHRNTCQFTHSVLSTRFRRLFCFFCLGQKHRLAKVQIEEKNKCNHKTFFF